MEERLRELRDQIKRCLDYREFYLRYCRGGDARPTNARLHTYCPIPAHNHSGKGHPSLSVDLQRGLFHCFSRDEGGDSIRFYELMHDVSFRRAISELARELGLKQTRQRSLAFRAAPDLDSAGTVLLQTLSADRMSVLCEAFLEACRCEDQTEGLNYLARRGINHQTVEQVGVSYFPRRAYHRVMRTLKQKFALEELQQSGLFNSKEHLTFYRHRLLFPFRLENRTVYLQARATAYGVEPRWHNLRGHVPTLYNVDALETLVSGTVIYLVEGFTDTLTLLAHGFPAVGIVGAGGFKEEWIARLARFRVVAALDPDYAGSRAAERYAELFEKRGVPFVHLPLPADVNDFFCGRASAPLEFALMTEAALEGSARVTR